jgi:hypothetical protein
MLTRYERHPTMLLISVDADEGRQLPASPALMYPNVRVKRGKYRIAIPHSESAQYTLGVSRLHQFARSCCSVSDHFTTQIFFYFPFICPLKSGKEFLFEFAHSCSRLAGNQVVIDVGRDSLPENMGRISTAKGWKILGGYL